MKCACNDPKCTTEVRFDSLSKAMLVERRDMSILIYLDPNSIAEMIAELRKCAEAILNRKTI
jgi:hypothetical protein